ncbi:uncharacterized protein BO97DRAFT_57954 [Aspergillus homomorphus CBS 101889]|uniref:Uncharacterized protein n=1 Tax=Aspergillus homomorphus (strain CBS 101889) TaxID=1450537 RepID=A0A395HX44_ASPHC|nr:hypothetical protein BO97DRAFT_57954 [Aspergillus homomorphus CBS 101889]RAL12481.1 hypothetical protein BO97DRAFT_57954 [Aspergillus homomorphus CBS 101889]
MASSIYTISVENQRGANSNYAVFFDTPEFTGGHEPWLNVWYTSFVPYQGNFEIRSGNDYYAWVGSVPTRPAPGVIVNNGMSLFAQTGTNSNPGSTFDLKIVEEFPTLAETEPAAHADAYEIKTGTDLNMPNDTYLVGLAKVNNRGQVVPVASVAPQNNQSIQIIPRQKFFITESQQYPGEIVDRYAVEREGATIDFSRGEGAGKFYARVVQKEDGRFEVTYSESFS